MDEPRPVGDALRRVRRDLGAPEPGAFEQLRAVWAELVGAALGDHSRPLGVRDGTLRVAVDDPAWGSQFRYLNDTLLEAVSGRFPHLAIREISVTAPSPRRGRQSEVDDPGAGFE